eukprot:TRINITY_DN10008_c0_g1_i1.p1 TRINITY_DN10008_c0_g1~~TRINITY_DN10008_c0_g1_i1.p1  ORF type:complete len:308 (-),score=70.34 TRINITY_DN10008_c0_g1_i1:49-972(-)
MGHHSSKLAEFAPYAKDKTVIVTGANTGIGFVTARELARYGAHVILACRSKEKGEIAVVYITKEIANSEHKGTVELMILDLSDLKSVRQFAADFKTKGLPLHILINNAGIMNVPTLVKTVDGFESTLAANHLGHFLLTNLLLDELKKSAPSKIINLSSFVAKQGHINFDDINTEKHYDKWKAYTQSKLANIIFTYDLAKKLEGTGVAVHAVNPGFVKTDLLKTSGAGVGLASAVAAKTPEQGAETSLFVALNPETQKITGKYWSKCKEHCTIAESHDPTVAAKLWDLSAQMVGLKEDEMIAEVKSKS